MSTARTSILIGFTLAACALALPACSGGTSSSANPTLDREQQQAATLKKRYPDVIMGTDVQNRTLAVYVNVDNMYSMDEAAEAAMKADALAQWKRVWASAHAHKHALLRLSVRDYYGKEIYSASARI